MKNYIILSLLFIFAACATTPFSETLSIYDRNQVAWSFSDGTGKVEGDGFLYRRDGMLVKCYGQQVNLIPVSDYAIERFTNILEPQMADIMPLVLVQEEWMKQTLHIGMIQEKLSVI